MAKKLLLTTVVQIKSGRNELTSAWVDLWVDPEMLLGIVGSKALWSKGKKSRMAKGSVEAIVRKHTIQKTVV